MLEGVFAKKPHISKKIFGIISSLFLLSIVFVIFIRVVFAADLVVSPSSTSVGVGAIVPVSVVVSSTDQPMNAVDGTMTFPNDLLEVSSISKAGSIIDFWVEEPSFSNANGKVSFQGTVLNTGYTGGRGKIITVNFRTKSVGTANLKFSNGVVLANDGNGTDITKQLIPSSISIEGRQQITPPPVSNIPVITSSTHPDQNKWYALRDAELAWDIPAGVTFVRYDTNNKPSSGPLKEYPPTLSSKSVTGLEDGIWYAHVQFKDSNGVWGMMGHYAIKVDGTKPDKFEFAELHRTSNTNPNVKIKFTAHDEMSGIDHYSVGIDSKEKSKDWVDDGTGIYSTEPLYPGNHTMYLRAYDRAGNYREASFDVNIEALVSPVLISVPASVTENVPFSVSGTSQYPNSKVKITFTSKDGKVSKELEAISDSTGSFVSSVVDGLNHGDYTAKARVFGSDGSSSYDSEAKSISVTYNWITRIGQMAQWILIAMIAIAILYAILFMILVFIRRKTKEFRELVHKEALEIDAVTKDSFKNLKEDLKKYLKTLENAKSVRQLTSEEAEILNRLLKDVDIAEKGIEKEIKDVEDMSK